MVNHSIFSRGIKYENMNILAWTILKNTQILNGCETFAFKYILNEFMSFFPEPQLLADLICVLCSFVLLLYVPVINLSVTISYFPGLSQN